MAKLATLFVLLHCALLCPQVAYGTPPPPKQVELTGTKAKKLGFSIEVARAMEKYHIAIEYPSIINRRLRPHSAEIVLLDINKLELNVMRVPIAKVSGLITQNYNGERVNMKIVIGYCESDGSSCTDFIIPSASSFIEIEAKK